MIRRVAGLFFVVLWCGVEFGFAQQPDEGKSAEPSKSQELASRNALLAAAGCGHMEVRFNVKADKHLHPTAQPQPGKALVYVFEEDLTVGGSPTTRVGLDGRWMGANRPQSYFYFSVDPGEHRLCTNWQENIEEVARLGAALNFTAEAGKTYYFRTTIQAVKDYFVLLEEVNSTEGMFLISGDAFSTSHVKTQEPQPD